MKYPLVVWKCSVCGVDTHVNPPTEPEMEEVEVEVKVPATVTVVNEDGEKQLQTVETTQKVKQKIQKMGTIKQQNMFNGANTEVQVPLFKDLYPRTIPIQLKVGNEQFQMNFCGDCYKEKQVRIREFWDFLESLPCR